MTDQYKEVDERFDKEFTCVVTYEKWPNEEEQRLREPQYKFKDFPNTNPKAIKCFIHSELEKVRQEAEDNMRKRCIEALPKERNLNTKFPTFGVNRENESWIRGFNVAIDQATQNINNLDKGK